MKMDDKFEIELVSEQSRKLTHDEHTLRTHARHIHHVHLHVYVQQNSDVRAEETRRYIQRSAYRSSRHADTYTHAAINIYITRSSDAASAGRPHTSHTTVHKCQSTLP